MMAAIELGDMTGEQLAALSQAPLAVLPLGSVEYHGPHGPLGTDLYLAQELARRVAGELDALLMPAVTYSHCPPATRRRTGTISILEETFSRYLEQVLIGIFDARVRGVLALNAHDGNTRPLQSAVDRVVDAYPNQFVLLVNWWETIPAYEMEELGFFSQNGGHGHGGPLEMAAADAAKPGTVRWESAVNLDVVFPPGNGAVRALSEGRHLPNWEGYHGRVEEGSLEKGQYLLDRATERIVSHTRAWIQELTPTG